MRNSSRNVLALAYLGDSVYEIYIQEYLLNKGIEKVNELQKESVKYVSARGQSKYLKDMMDSNLLTEEELSIVYRARNHKGSSHPKNTDIVTYKYATGLEALIGWLYLENNQDRIDEIMNYILNNNH
ncbi:MAG: ribonuclease III domain-containing protein [Bacilli bacterium]|nr:ribonuclease III domain-containing protein [Bacilli bacterium]